MASLPADRAVLPQLICKEHVMSPLLLIDLARAIDADRRRGARRRL